MDDADDADYWAAAAFVHPEMAAQQIARFRSPHWNPPWRDLLPPPAASVSLSSYWGSRRKRSRTRGDPGRIRIRNPKGCGAARASPATPLDFGSGSGSAGGSVEASSSLEKNPRTADDDVSRGGGGFAGKVDVMYLWPSPLSFSTSDAKDIRRLGKKKTKCELQEEEKLLLEEKIMLKKEVEFGRKAYRELQEENERLKSQQSTLQPERVPTIIAGIAVSSMPSSGSQFLLPDLNEPPSENLD